MKLSILVPSVAERRKTFLPKILDALYSQVERLPQEKQDQVEVLFLIDNKTIMLGDKRNLLIEMAAGKYVAFVDCDDRITPDYIETLLKATKTDSDCIVFKAEVRINGGAPKICHYSKEYPSDYNTPTTYHRLPNHICCIKKAIAQKVPFPSIKYREDSGFSKAVKRHLKTQTTINRVLYFYDYNDDTTVAQEDVPRIRAKRKSMVKLPDVDVVFISKAKDFEGQIMTQTAIDTAITGAPEANLNCIVIESTPGFAYNDASTYAAPDPEFNYNKFLNFGATKGNAPWVMFCNNDLKFEPGWLEPLIAAKYPIVSPIAPGDSRQAGARIKETGWQCGRHLSGWAFLIKRELLNQIGGLDEDFKFWFADNALIGQLKKINTPPMLVPESRVHHLGSQTLRTLDPDHREDLMWEQLEHFNAKYKERLFLENINYQRWKKKRK